MNYDDDVEDALLSQFLFYFMLQKAGSGCFLIWYASQFWFQRKDVQPQTTQCEDDGYDDDGDDEDEKRDEEDDKDGEDDDWWYGEEKARNENDIRCEFGINVIKQIYKKILIKL